MVLKVKRPSMNILIQEEWKFGSGLCVEQWSNKVAAAKQMVHIQFLHLLVQIKTFPSLILALTPSD